MKVERGERVLLKKPRTVDKVAAAVTDLQVVFRALDLVVFADFCSQLRSWDVFPRFKESFQVRSLTLKSEVGDVEQVFAEDQPHPSAENQFGKEENCEVPQRQSQTDGKPLHAAGSSRIRLPT